MKNHQNAGNLNSVRSTLLRLYRLNISREPREVTIDEIWEEAVELCSALPVTAENYWWYRKDELYADIQKSIKHHIVTEQLLFFKDMVTPHCKSLSDLVSNDLDAPKYDKSNFHKLFMLLVDSCYPEVFNISCVRHNTKTSYDIPSTLKYLIQHVVWTIMKNPFIKRNRNCSFVTIKNFIKTFYTSINKTISSNEMKLLDIDQYLISYYALRLFDVDILAYISNKLVDHQFELSTQNLLKGFAHIVKLPLAMNKRLFVDMFFLIKDEDNKKGARTKLDDWNEIRKGIIATLSESKSKVSIEETTMQQWIAYINFLSSTYIPVLSACFYVLLCDYNQAENTSVEALSLKIIRILEEYISPPESSDGSQPKPSDAAQALIVQCKEINFPSRESRDIFQKLYSAAYDVFYEPNIHRDWNNAIQLDYVSNYAPYIDDLLQLVIQEKAEMHL